MDGNITVHPLLIYKYIYFLHMSKTERAVIVYGNTAHLKIQMFKYDNTQGDWVDFNMTEVSDLTVFLICNKHATHIDLSYVINQEHNNILECEIDYRLLHPNAAYGVVVEGYDSNEEHFRYEALPSECFLVVSNSSGLKLTDNVTTIDLSARCGWGIATTTHADWAETDPEKVEYIENKPDIDGMIDSALENYYDKTETDTLLDNKADAADLNDYYTKTETDTLLDTKADAADLGDYYTKTETDTLLDNKADASDLANKQDVLVSGDNIKTINNQSLLGSGNIDIQIGGSYTAGNNIDITNNTISLEDDITVSSVTINKHIDYVLWWDGDNRYLAEEAMLDNQFQVGQNWYDIGDEYKLYIKTGQADYTINGSEWVHAEQPYPSYVPIYDNVYRSTTQVNGEYVYGKYNEDSGNPDFYIYDDNVTINDVYVEYEFLEQSDWNETNPNDPGYIHNKPDLSIYAQSSSLATVATSGDYNDLSNTPTIPAAPVQSDWNESDNTTLSYILNKPDLSNYATQSDLANKQDTLVSGTNIKTINGTSVLGSGDITISGGGVQSDWNETDSSSLAYILNKPTINTPGFNQLVNGSRTGLVSSLSTDYKTNIGKGAVIEGNGNITDKIEASGELSHAEGFCTYAKGQYSHTEGIQSTAQGQFSHAEGMNTKTNNFAEHASGGYNISVNNSSTWGNSGNTLFSVGNGKNLHPHNAVEIKQNGDIYIPDTNNTTYSNFYEKPMLKLQDVIANKQDVLVSGTNIKTINNTSILGSGDITISGGGVQSDWNETDSSSLAYILNKPTIPAAQVQSDWNENDNTSLAYIQNKPTISDPGFVKLVNGANTGLLSSIAVNYNTNIGNLAIIEGRGTAAIKIEASGSSAHAEGQSTKALGICSHAEGNTTVASNTSEHAEGQHNVSTLTNTNFGDTGNTLSSIGNGKNNTNRHNAFEVRQNGDIYYSDTEKIDGSTVHYYDAPMRKLQDVMVTSTTNGLKIEVVSALPASPSNDTIYVIV